MINSVGCQNREKSVALLETMGESNENYSQASRTSYPLVKEPSCFCRVEVHELEWNIL